MFEEVKLLASPEARQRGPLDPARRRGLRSRGASVPGARRTPEVGEPADFSSCGRRSGALRRRLAADLVYAAGAPSSTRPSWRERS
jgi:hypothetical protein